MLAADGLSMVVGSNTDHQSLVGARRLVLITNQAEAWLVLFCAGAIDVDELQYALSVMGIDKSPAEVQELMDSVDKDGSGVHTSSKCLLSPYHRP